MRSTITALMIAAALVACGSKRDPSPSPSGIYVPSDATTWPSPSGRISAFPYTGGGGGGGSTGGGGGVSSVTSSNGALSVANSTSTPDLALNITAAGVAHKAVTNIGADGVAAIAYFVDAVSGAAPCTSGQFVSQVSLSNNTLTFTCSAPSGGGGSGIVNDYTGTTVQVGMEGFCTASTSGSCGEFVVAASGTSAAQSTSSGLATAASRPGFYRWSTGTTNTGRLAMTTTATVLLGGGAWSAHAIFGTEQLSNSTDEYQFEFGYIDTSTGINQADGVYFTYDRGNVLTAPTTGAGNTGNADKWMCWSASNNVRTGYLMDGTVVSDGAFTTVNQPVGVLSLPNTNIYNLDIECNAAATECDFYVNGTKSCVITTHIPTGASRATGVGFVSINSAGTGAGRLFDVDAMWAVNTLSSVRSP